MTSLLAASVADVVTTGVGLNVGLTESGFAGSHFIESGNPDAAYVSRVAVTALLIGVYALSKEYPGRFSYSIDKAMNILNVVAWGIVVLNTAQIAGLIK